MRWIEGEHPKIGKSTGIRGSKRYLVRFMDNSIRVKHWIGNRFHDMYNGANKVTHYMLIAEVKK